MLRFAVIASGDPKIQLSMLPQTARIKAPIHWVIYSLLNLSSAIPRNVIIACSFCFVTGPVKAFKGDTAKDPIFIDVGLYGYSPKKNFDSKASLRRMEKFARDNDGYQVQVGLF